MNLPNKITLTRIILVGALLIFFLVSALIPNFAPFIGDPDHPVYIVNLVGCVTFIVAASTDALDGHIARSRHLVTDLGKFLDPVADKLLVDSSLIILAIRSAYAPENVLIPAACVVIMIIRDLVVDALRFIAAGKGVVLAANIFGKIKTVAQMVAIPFIFLNGWPFSYFDASWGYFRISLILIYIATAASLLSGLIYVIQNRAVLKEGKGE